ncbi:MAG: hypothetical protein ACYCYE_05130 [Clostridia bacterium]
MKMVNNMPIVIVITALLINIIIGVNNSISFPTLMIRCIVVTVVFGVFSHMVTETVRNAVECSGLSKLTRDKAVKRAELEETLNNNKSMLDIKVPPLDDEEFLNMDNDSDNEFVEVNPVYMGKYDKDEQD